MKIREQCLQQEKNSEKEKKRRREVCGRSVEAIQNKHTYISHTLETYDFDGG